MASRLLVVVALGLSGCVSSPTVPAPTPFAPTREMSDGQFADWLSLAMPEVCAAPQNDYYVRRATGARWGLTPLPEHLEHDFMLVQAATNLRVTLPVGSTPCELRLRAPTSRLIAVDDSLKAWTASRLMTSTVPDMPEILTPGLENRRVRGRGGQGEAALSWRYVPAENLDADAEMELTWSAASR
jgi:hypothetical protein